MTALATIHTDVDDERLRVLRAPRTDIVLEAADGPDAWRCVSGPFLHYRRWLVIDTPAPGGQITEHYEYQLAAGLWSPLINQGIKRALRTTDRRPKRRWWWPGDVVSAETTRLVSLLVLVSITSSYLGVIVGQTITFAAEDFGASDQAQSNALAATRIGVLLSMLFLRHADRRGRRPLIVGFLVVAIGFTVLGALSPNLKALAASQTVARGFTTGLITLVILAVTEEVPAASRAFAISVVTVAGGLGAGMVVWTLPLADLVSGGWRISYVAALAFIPVVWTVARHLPETRRFRSADRAQAPGRVNWYRFGLLAVTVFLAAIFLAPAGQLRNEYLNDDLGFTSTQVAAFQLVIFAPGSAAIMVAGWAADRFGRRWLAGICLSVGALATAASYLYAGLGLWIFGSLGVVAISMAYPATRGYQTELFPTRARARVGAWLDVIGVAGSATGLALVGVLASRWDDLGRAIAAPAVFPILVAVIIVALFPETASHDLERFNPGDPEVELY